MKKLIYFIIACFLLLQAITVNAGTSTSNVTAYSPYTVSAFGDEIVSPLKPIIQLSFVHGINNQLGSVGTPLNSATVDTNEARLRLQTGTNSAGAAAFVSNRALRYREGVGSLVRFTAAYTACAANSMQLAGMANYTASASNTAFVDGLLVGCNGANFGILYRNNSSDTFIAQSAFNIDKLDGTGASKVNWDKTKGNIIQIEYPFLGYGDITFLIQNSETGYMIPFHRIKYANSSASVELSNPNLSFYALALNSGNTSNLTLYVGSVAAFVTGEESFNGAQNSFGNRKAAITTRTSVATVRMATTINGVAAKGVTRVRSCSFACDGGNDTCLFDLVKNTTLGGTPSYTPINGSTADGGATLTSANSALSVDTAGTTVTGGTIVFNAAAARNTGYQIDLSPYRIFLVPGETLTAAITGDSSLAARVACNVDEAY